MTSLLELANQQKSVLALGDADNYLEDLCKLDVKPKLVLIDPPYNRKTKFHHYNDHTCSIEWSETLERHCRSLHQSLDDSGSLWMHIDDSEMISARLMLDKLFGKNNFIASVIWQKSVSRDNRTTISTTHEYILVYAKNKSIWKSVRSKLPATEEQTSRYKNKDNDPRGPWTSGDLTAKAGPGRRAEQFYEITLPSGRVVSPSKGTAWRFTRERFNELVADNRIYFGQGNSMPRLKRFLSETDPGLVPDTWWSGADVGTADTAKKHLKSLFPDLTPFETPKPEELASRIIHIATNEGDLVVDIYGGSGTTAAVSHKMGRKWISTEREPRTFYEFTKPRIEMVINGADNGGITKSVGWLGGGSFSTVEKSL
ncbi:site-specific DNA-methyltransferase [Pseudoalteromonas piscicida]|uniref:site-specific DNA-methyltransferase (adenine-specific) n=1 Tax=Pseudoalteromonas piscicida TaxID=43662 RepID=A0A2A5JMC7_PSEO7|nr:site-specific DNA-methyltransferase [Pseudoalteromonas piscicida]PCK30585.1 site-specific DNA-methyltransferase [Pseudoalteromonas piscicida]